MKSELKGVDQFKRDGFQIVNLLIQNDECDLFSRELTPLFEQQPPREILDGMVTVRLHLDECNANNGALKVIPQSHAHGKLDAIEISKQTQNEIVVCEVPKGGALLMYPLLLHSSSPAKNPSHRRVLHIEYATHELPNGLKWFEQ